MAFGGLALRSLTTALYAVAFCCSTIVLGIYSYFMATRRSNNMYTPDWIRATIGISGATTAYLILPVLLTCFFGAHKVFACMGILLNIVFMGAFIALAVLTRDGSHSCNGVVITPVGTGLSFDDAPGFSDFQYACRLNQACFAVSIIGIITLFMASLGQLSLRKHHKHEYSRQQATSAPDYVAPTSSGKFWNRGPKTQPNHSAGYNPTHNPGYVEAGMEENKHGYNAAAGPAYPK